MFRSIAAKLLALGLALMMLARENDAFAEWHGSGLLPSKVMPPAAVVPTPRPLGIALVQGIAQ